MSDYEEDVDIEVTETTEKKVGGQKPKAAPKGVSKFAKGKAAKIAQTKAANKKTTTKDTSVAVKGVSSTAALLSGEVSAEASGYRSCTGVLHSDPMSRDVKIGGFNLSAWSQELITDSSIELTIGRRYGLIGANGSGKTTFLKCIAAREVPVPDHIDIFLLENEAPATDMTGIEWISSQVQNEITRLETLAENLCEEFGPESLQLQQVYDDIAKLEELNPETHAAVLLHGLGFGPQMMAKPTKSMSGGWRMRVALAKALFVRPTLLLLDEPTNHLDLETCVWLENHLATYDKCLVVNSHSQDFLNSVCTNIIELTPKLKLVNWTGNYDTFIQTKHEVEVNLTKKYEKEQADIKHIKEFIASCGTFSNLVRQAKSKQKILDKMYADGLTEKPTPPPAFNFKFAECDRLAPPVMQFHDVSFAYSGKLEDALYHNVNLAIDSDSRVAIVGPNGTGKSTLLKLMVDEIQPTAGSIKRHLDIRIGRYHQHVTAELIETMNPLEFISHKYSDVRRDEEAWRGVIGRYGITGKMQKSKISHMSDGQKCRLVFCMLAVANPNMLLLDEPTNHLDMQCIDALAEAIKSFSGGVVLVSHDFRLLSQVANQIWVVDNSAVKIFGGDIRDYKKHLVEYVQKKYALGITAPKASH